MIRAARGGRFATARLALAAIVGAGCADDPPPEITIQQMQAPQVDGAQCTASNDPASPAITEGIFDLALHDRYSVRPLIANHVVHTPAPGVSWGDEFATTNIQGFTIELRAGTSDGPLVAPPFNVYQNIVLYPARSPAQLGYNWGQIVAISPEVGAALKSTVCHVDDRDVTPQCPVPRLSSSNRRIVVRMAAFGESLGSDSVRSPPFDFPVTVCCGCLLQFPSGSTLDSSPVLNCDNGSAPTTAAICAPGQDYPVDCRACSATNPSVCQPRGYSPSGAACPR